MKMLKSLTVYSMLLLGFILFSCSKSDNSTNPPVAKDNYMPDSTGNYWIRENYVLDSNGNRTSTTPMMDSAVITQKTTYSGQSALKLCIFDKDNNGNYLPDSIYYFYNDDPLVYYNSNFLNDISGISSIPVALPLNNVNIYNLIGSFGSTGWEIYSQNLDSVSVDLSKISTSLSNGKFTGTFKINGNYVQDTTVKLDSTLIPLTTKEIKITLTLSGNLNAKYSSIPVTAPITLNRYVYIYFAKDLGMQRIVVLPTKMVLSVPLAGDISYPLTGKEINVVKYHILK